MKELVAPCGLYCGACAVYKASSDRALAEKIAQRRGISPDKVRCRGCRAEKGIIGMQGTSVCRTYDCAVNQKVEFCYQCKDFPCLKLAPCADRAQEIPHNMKVYNLVSIRSMGLERWLETAEKAWNQYFRGKKPRGGDELQA